MTQRSKYAARHAELRRLKARHPRKWLSLIRQCSRSKAVRVKVACVVYWDFFSLVPAGKPLGRLGAYLAAYRKIGNERDSNDVIKALMALGYSDAMAVERGTPPVNYNGRGEA